MGTLRIRVGNDSWTVDCDALAATSGGLLLLAGCVGPATSLKAIHAALCCQGKVDIFPDVPHGPNEYRLLYDSAGYERYIARVALGTWQMLLVSRMEGFMPVMNRPALWRRLASEQFTTPLLKAWLPWLEQQLIAADLLVPLRCFNCRCGWLKATTDDLDKLVSEGLQTRALTIA